MFMKLALVGWSHGVSRGVWSAAVAAIALAGAGGCGESGPETAHLRGTITLGGQPLPADATGQVMFLPTTKDQAKASSAVIEGGAYDAPAAPVGKVTVMFSITQPTGPEYTTDRGNKVRDSKNIVPDRHSAGIPLEVQGDNETQNFDL